MKIRKIVGGLILSTVLAAGVGAAVGATNIISNNGQVKEVKANNTSVTFYLAINASTIGDGAPYYSRRLDDTGWVDGIGMTLVEDGITFAGKKVFSSTFTELYGGADMYLKYWDGSKDVVVHPWSGNWGTKDTFDGKVYTFENGDEKTWATYTVPTQYSFIGSESDWATDRDLTSNGDGTYSITRDINRGDTFKFRMNHIWANQYGYKTATGTGASFFQSETGNEGDNFECLLNGNYTIKFNPSTTSYVIIDNTATTYSYVLTKSKEYTCAYLYNSDTDKYTEWADSPALSSFDGDQAYDLSFVYSGNTYQGVYKISDRWLSTFSYLILKKAGDVSGTYTNQSDTFTLGGGHKVYVGSEGSTSSEAYTSDLYNAAEFAHDLVANRGNATYEGYDFAYSICATSSSTAADLVSRFDKLSSSARTIISNSKCYVYDVTGTLDEGTKSDQSLVDLVDALRIVAARANNANLASLILGINGMSFGSAPIVIIIVSVITLSAIGGYYFFSKNKKKEN